MVAAAAGIKSEDIYIKLPEKLIKHYMFTSRKKSTDFMQQAAVSLKRNISGVN